MASVKGIDGVPSGQPEPFPCGVWGDSRDGAGVEGTSAREVGVTGISLESNGVVGISRKPEPQRGLEGGSGVYGDNSERGGIGVQGRGTTYGVVGRSTQGYGVRGDSPRVGVYGKSDNAGVAGDGKAVGVSGVSQSGYGVDGTSETGFGVRASSRTVSLFAQNLFRPEIRASIATDNWAADLVGNVFLTGDLFIRGALRFFKPLLSRIDHPLDPAHKYLSHSFVESPDMKNIYDGVVTLDENGGASVSLPDWFEALNTDFRYQLTPLGSAAPNLHVAEEVSGNSFRVGGGVAGMKVCWQVTGIRRDAWAQANQIQVEEEKPEEERGYYLHPHLYGETEAKDIRALRSPESPEREE